MTTKPNVPQALHAAVQAIYFDDSSDYRTALYDVVQYLAPELIETLENDPRAAWERTDAARSTLAAHTAREAEPVAWEPSGPLDANELERMAKSHPDKCFLKGSGVLKLLGAIRALEQSARAAPQPAALLKPVYQVYIGYEGWNDIAEDDIASYESDGFSVRTLYEQPEGACGS